MSQFITKMFYKQRDDFARSCIERDRNLTLPDGITVKSDIPYINDGISAHRLDIYRPAGRDNDVLPVMINIHGGGLLLGSKEFNRCFCANIAALGYMVYSIEYRLIPDCNFFNQIDDVERAFDYISARIESDNGDSKHIYASTDSGGACLLTYATAVNGSRDIARAAHVRPSGIKFNAIGFISGMFYTDRFDRIGLFLPNYLYGRGYKKNRFAPYVNPGNNDIIKTLPPCYMVTSHNDHLQKYTLDYEKALTKGGIRHKLDNYPKNKKLTHAFSVFEPFMDESFEVIHSMTEFFSHY